MCEAACFLRSALRPLQQTKHNARIPQVKWELDLRERTSMREVRKSPSPGLENATGVFGVDPPSNSERPRNLGKITNNIMTENKSKIYNPPLFPCTRL